MKTAVVVGGGITGILSALILKDHVEDVYLIEKEEKCGGLLRSVQNELGVNFDLGTHIPAETLTSGVDHYLFDGMENGDWNVIPILEVGNVFCGKLYDKSQYVYTPFLPREKYEKGLIELLSCTDAQVNSDNLLNYATGYYGATFTKEIFGPLMRKLLGENLDHLHTSALHLFSYTRLIPGEAELARNLKHSPVYDKKLAYASFLEGVAEQRKFYPKQRKGIELWIDYLIEKAINKGVKILQNTIVQDIKVENDKIKSIVLQNEDVLETDFVVWTTAPAILLKLANINVTSAPPAFRKMTLHNYVFDKPFLTKNHYVYCTDEHVKAFRITLYPNISPQLEQEEPYNCTVEVLTEQDVDVVMINNAVIKELKEIGVVDKEAKTLYQDFIEIKHGFPIITNEFIQAVQNQKEAVEKHLTNVLLVGKASGETFFINEASIDTYNKISAIFAKSEIVEL